MRCPAQKSAVFNTLITSARSWTVSRASRCDLSIARSRLRAPAVRDRASAPRRVCEREWRGRDHAAGFSQRMQPRRA